jgi:hypothetical protein
LELNGLRLYRNLKIPGLCTPLMVRPAIPEEELKGLQQLMF